MGCEKVLSESECLVVVKNALEIQKDDFELISFKVVPVSSDILGFLGEYFHLQVVIKRKKCIKDEELVFFVKSSPLQNAGQRELVEKLDVFRREKAVYGMLFQELDKHNNSRRWHGKCLYARNDLLVMEDLTKSQFKHLDSKESFSRRHLDIILKYTATMHANSLAFEYKTGINIGEKYGSYLTETAVTPECSWYRAGMNGLRKLIDIHPKYQNPEIKKYISNNFNKFVDKTFEIVRISKDFRNVFCHRDLWDKNILFKYNPENSSELTECIFLDFQICRYHPPALDVLQFIYLNTSAQNRKYFLWDYLKYYHDHLLTEGKRMGIDVSKDIPWKEFERSCVYGRLLALILGGIYVPVASLPDGYMNDIKIKDPEKYNYYVTCDRQELILDYMKKDEKYNKNLLEIVEEIVEYLLDMEKAINGK